MLRTIPDEGLSRPAKALLKLLKWAEKEELIKELPKQNKLNHGCLNDDQGKNNTNRCQREDSGAIECPTYTKAGS